MLPFRVKGGSNLNSGIDLQLLARPLYHRADIPFSKSRMLIKLTIAMRTIVMVAGRRS
jgi:hypothetical protein